MNIGQTALQVLKTVAPTLATAALGPFGPLAAAAISMALGTPAGDAKAAEAALVNATPDQLLALKKSEQEFAVQMKTLGIEEEKLGFDDTANARAREMAVKDSTPSILAYGTTVGFFIALAALHFVPIPQENKATIYAMVSSLGTVWILQMGYYFGSSRGSDDKSKMLAEIAKQS